MYCQDWLLVKLQLYWLLCTVVRCICGNVMGNLSAATEPIEGENREQLDTDLTDIVGVLETIHFDEDLFGDCEDKEYPAQCSICALDWAHDDVLKVTPCRHIFHAGCLASWLNIGHDCPLCRWKLV